MKSTVTESVPFQRSSHTFPAVGLLAIFVLAVFGRTISFGFLNWDDNSFVRDNPLVIMPGLGWTLRALTQSHAAYYAPVLWWAFRIQYYLWGLEPAGYHAVNIALHCANAVLLAILLQRIGLKRTAAFLGAALWAVHPLRAESVAWITELKDVLSAFFCLHCAIFYLCAVYPTRNPAMPFAKSGIADRRAYCLSLIFFLAGLGTKPTVAAWPVLLFLFDAFAAFFGKRFAPLDAMQLPGGSNGRKRLLSSFIRLAPMFATAAVVTVVMMRLQTAEPPLDGRAPGAWGVNIIVACYSFAFHLAKTFLPIRLSALYNLPSPVPYSPFFAGVGLSDSPHYLAGAVATLVLLYAIGWLFNRNPAACFALLFYVVGMIPMAQFVPTPRPLADRYTYLPTIAIMACVGDLLGRASDRQAESVGRRRLLLTLPSVTLCLMLAACCWARLGVWRNSVALWEDAIAKGSSDQITYGNYGLALIEAGRFADARSPMLKAAAAHPRDPRPWFHLARIESFLGNESLSSDAALNWARLSFPNATDLIHQAHAARLLVEAKAGDIAVATARAAALRARAEIPDEAAGVELALEMVFLESKSLTDRGRYAEAAALLSDAVSRFPAWANGFLSLGIAQMEAGRWDEAEKTFARWRDLAGNDEDFMAWKAEIAMRRGDLAAAERICREALGRSPDNPRLLVALSRILTMQGRLGEAEKCFARAFRMAPDLLSVADAYAWALHKMGRNCKALNVLDKFAANLWTEPEPARRFAAILEAAGQSARADGFRQARERWAAPGK